MRGKKKKGGRKAPSPNWELVAEFLEGLDPHIYLYASDMARTCQVRSTAISDYSIEVRVLANAGLELYNYLKSQRE